MVDSVNGQSSLENRTVGYSQWNEALAAAFFNDDRAGELVYLDQDDNAFTLACEALGLEAGHKAQESLAEAVRSTLCWKSSFRSMFSEFDNLTKQWVVQRRAALIGKKNLAAPPHIALLMLLSIAAESMGATSAKGEPHAGGYYVQLEHLLRVPEQESSRLRQSFAESTEAYWEALNVWLEDLGGSRGLPSAYALMYRYVGLPISQALIRDTERRNLEKFFEEHGFVAGSAVSHVDMHASLDIWLNSNGWTANAALRKIWSVSGNQNRVTDLALAQFAVWQGPSVSHADGQTRSRNGRCLLTWRSERRSLVSVSKFGLVVMQGLMEGDTGTVEAENGAQINVQFNETGNRSFGVNFGENAVDPLSLVSGDVKIRMSEGAVLRRIPKNVVLFARDPLTATYVEVDRVLAGTESRILVRQSDDLALKVERVLVDAAQPGYRTVEGGSIAGIPRGWIAYLDVKLMRSPAAALINDRDLTAFQPRLSTQMALQGGLRFPGRTQRWSAVAPLSLVITSDEEDVVDLYRVERDPESLHNIDVLVGRSLVPPLELSVNDLSQGRSDFSLSLRRNGKTLQNLQIRLRGSGVGPDRNPEPRAIAHAVGTPLWPLTAVEDSDAATGWVEGSTTQAEPINSTTGQVPTSDKIRWSHPSIAARSRKKLRLPGPTADSCIVTGHHRFQLPTFDGRYPKTPWMYGECSGCGMSKRFPTRNQKNPKNDCLQLRPRTELPAVQESFVSIEWSTVLDALVYLGSGTRRDFSVLVRQIEDSALFERRALHALESVAFLELERNDRLETVSWEVVYKGIAGLEEGSWVLTGSWTQKEKQSFQEAVETTGGDVSTIAQDLHTVVQIDGVVNEVMPIVAKPFLDLDSITPRAARKLAGALPPLSRIVEELPREILPAATFYEYFMLETASWIEIEAANLPGLYRLPRLQGAGYYLRTQNDVSCGTAARVWAELGKHLAGNILGQPLLAYESETRTLRVPLGAELPGLYGRAAVLATGLLPRPEPRIHSVSYTDIAPETASILIGKLTS